MRGHRAMNQQSAHLAYSIGLWNETKSIAIHRKKIGLFFGERHQLLGLFIRLRLPVHVKLNDIYFICRWSVAVWRDTPPNSAVYQF
jgi:hypothetical protein